MKETIRKNEIFSALNEAELDALMGIVQHKAFGKNELVFDTAQSASFIYIVAQGSFLLHTVNDSYKTLYEGDLFGEIGIINADLRTGSVWAAEPSTAIAVCGTRLFKEEYIPSRLALKVVMALSRKITNYLRTREQISTTELICRGENDYVEFKSTLRWNLHSQKKDPAIENAVLKTLAAFMNSTGGTLLIGVADDGKVLGLDADQFGNMDKMLLFLTQLVNDRISPLHTKFLHPTVEQISGGQVLRVDCQPATLPAYVKDAVLEHFYIRTGPSTIDLRLSKVYEYVKTRFETNKTTAVAIAQG
ncbi:MAG: cyclic nucleotide-binding domain-containing protein [Bacteroidetes bacterium]|nr:cyclic nucleotide-binding domain-containing protein [Bacteroidota bacterium]